MQNSPELTSGDVFKVERQLLEISSNLCIDLHHIKPRHDIPGKSRDSRHPWIYVFVINY